VSSSYSSDPLFYYFAVAFLLLFALLVSLFTSMFMQLRIKKEHKTHEDTISNIETELTTAQKNVKELERRNVYLERENLRLNPYAVMPDAFAEVKQQRDKAQKTLLQSTQQANLLLNQARKDADAHIAESRKQAVEKNEVANIALRQARERADSILTDAALRAEQVAGDAWDAKNRLVFYQRTAVAMKNKVTGYGNDYLIPNETLIDDLSEDYSHEQAGRHLKRISEQIKTMIRDGTAADCDYKADLLKERSIAFVLDAFNGKAESILAKADVDNFGKMQAKLEDAFELVNYNGKSFNNTRILPAYADLYQAQLKYAIQVKELKRRDEEEQRRIKSDMSEQKQVKKEFKKVIHQARKESKRILKVIKKTEANSANSTGAEKLEYQAQLAELMEQLSNAEAQLQRTESMTQLNNRGYVYVVSNIGSFGDNVLKIGMTRRAEPLDKVKELNKFKDKRVNMVNQRPGFFSVALGEVRAEIDSLNLECRWTMKADALEYWETVQLKQTVEKEYVRSAEILEIG